MSPSQRFAWALVAARHRADGLLRSVARPLHDADDARGGMILHLYGPRMAELVAVARADGREPCDPASLNLTLLKVRAYVVVREEEDQAAQERRIARHLQHLPEGVDVAYLTEERPDGSTPGAAIRHFADVRIRVDGDVRTLTKRREGVNCSIAVKAGEGENR